MAENVVPKLELRHPADVVTTVWVPLKVHRLECTNTECKMTFAYFWLHYDEEGGEWLWTNQVFATYCPYCGVKQ